jgi:Ca-activated chloride channel family protein
VTGLRRWLWVAAFALVAAAVAGAAWMWLPLSNPTGLAWATAAVAYVAGDAAWWAWRDRVERTLGRAETVRRMTARFSPARRAARTWLLGAAMLLAAVAIARPQWGERSREIKRRGIDLVVAIDVSRSMLADDVSPNRLRAAIREIDTLLRELDGDRVGLVVFSGIGFVQSPLTSDYGAIRLYLERLKPEDMPVQGTAIGRALTEATKLLTGNGAAGFERADTQLVAVFTDGEDHESDPVAAARDASGKGIHVYTFGVGTDAGARIPLRNPDGSVKEYLSDRQGNVVQTRLVEGQLREIAKAGDGKYLRYAGDQSLAGFMVNEIDGFDAKELATMLRREREDQFAWFAAPALLLAIVALALGDGRRRRLSPVLALLLLTGCDDLLLRNDPVVVDALAKRAAGDHAGAAARIEEASAEARERPEFDFDRGLILHDADRRADARDALLRALRTQDPATQVTALVALGNLLLEEQAYDDAIERFRRALTIDPDNAAARRNLEIALRLKFPPCSALEDKQEENDDPSGAKPLTAKFFKGEFKPEEPSAQGAPPAAGSQAASADEAKLVSCGGDADWYLLPAVAGARVNVEVNLDRLRDDTGSTPPPDRISPRDVSIAIVGPDGVSVIAEDNGEAAGAAEVPARKVQRRIEGARVPSTHAQGAPVYLRVTTARGLEMTYTPSVEILPPCSAVEDRFEPNNDAAAATTADSGAYEARICAGNDDWYRAALQPGDTLFVDGGAGKLATEAGEAGELEMSRYDAPNGAAIESQRADGSMGLGFEVAADQRGREVWFRAQGVGGAEGAYKLDVLRVPACPSGNDPQEPNNEPGAAKPIDLTKAPFRHLRLCDGDVDWYALTLPEVEKEGSGAPPPTRPVSAVATWRGGPRSVVVRLYDPTTARQLATSAGNPAPTDPTSGISGAVAAVDVPSATTQLLVAVDGDPGFYDLSFPELQKQAQQPSGQQDSGDQGDQKQDPSDANQQDGDKEPGGQQGDPQQGEGDSAEEQPAGGDEAAEEGSGEGASPEGEGTGDDEKRRLMQLLNSLEPADDNLQLRQALDHAPPVYIEKEW